MSARAGDGAVQRLEIAAAVGALQEPEGPLLVQPLERVGAGGRTPGMDDNPFQPRFSRAPPRRCSSPSPACNRSRRVPLVRASDQLFVKLSYLFHV
mgnify:CR=1 FL=1